MLLLSRKFSRLAGIAVVALLGLFVGIQFIRPELAAAPVTRAIPATQPVRQILQTACYNCHSSDTRLLWFDQIVPAYWLVVADVKRARARLDFSNFSELPPAQERAILFEAVNQIQSGAMPPKNYRLLHPEARVSPEQIEVLKAYLLQPQQNAGVASNGEPAPTCGGSRQVQAAPNGIAFMPQYSQWTALSSTERYDNHTLRVILGNDVATRAADAGHTNPWPDGAVFAKVAWEQSANPSGLISAGRFLQVEFMIKDAKTYSSTLGWGWARWRGTDLQPYGKTAEFTHECTGCHAPMRDRDFVFTTPVRNRGASHDTTWRVISTGFNPREGTMSTLYGDPATAERIRCGGGPVAGKSLSQVTWTQQEDSHWFGARVPAALQSVHRLDRLDNRLPLAVMP